MNREVKRFSNLVEEGAVHPAGAQAAGSFESRSIFSFHIARHVGCVLTRVPPGGINPWSERPRNGPGRAPLLRMRGSWLRPLPPVVRCE
jgi:hypothetical protein